MLLERQTRLMDRTLVKSSHMKSMGYSKDDQILEVEFKNGDVYQYLDVPLTVFAELTRSTSKGKFMHRHIRGKYQYKRVDHE